MTRIICFALLLVSSCANAEWHSGRWAIMGTEITAVLWHEDAEQGQRALNAVKAEMERIDAEYNPWDSNSELYRVNQQAVVKAVSVSREMVTLFDKALYMGKLTEGAFDVSFASVGHGYDYRKGTKPDDKTLAQTIIDYRLIELDRTRQTVKYGHANIVVDLGGIAKGYAVDRAIALLVEQDIEHASVSAGGDSRVLGDRRGRPWVVGIQNPRNDQDVAIKVPLVNEALSTSGDYERFFIDENGERVHHILNPRTGKSASGIASVSVLGPNGFDTDPLSTSVFVMGVEKGLELIEKLPEFEAIIIDASGKVYYSSGLQEPE